MELGYYQSWTINSGSGEGGQHCTFNSISGANRAVLLASDGPGAFATTDEIDLLIRFSVSALQTEGGIYFWNDAAAGKGYGLVIDASGDCRLNYFQFASPWDPIGAAVTKGLLVDTLYYLRVHRMNNTDGHQWSWGIDTVPPTTWDLGDGDTGGTANSGIVTGKVGVGAFVGSAVDINYDWFSAADGSGAVAPGPAGGATIIPPGALTTRQILQATKRTGNF